VPHKLTGTFTVKPSIDAAPLKVKYTESKLELNKRKK